MINSLAVFTASFTGFPFASSAVIAAEYVQPAPCVFVVSIFSDSRMSNVSPSYRTSIAVSVPSLLPPLIRTYLAPKAWIFSSLLSCLQEN